MRHIHQITIILEAQAPTSLFSVFHFLIWWLLLHFYNRFWIYLRRRCRSRKSFYRIREFCSLSIAPGKQFHLWNVDSPSHAFHDHSIYRYNTIRLVIFIVRIHVICCSAVLPHKGSRIYRVECQTRVSSLPRYAHPRIQVGYRRLLAVSQHS